MNDLWAKDIGTEKVRTPVAVLREQASLLGKKTKNIVLAAVVSSNQNNPAGSQFFHRFNLKAPALGNYSYTLFSIVHFIDLYPLHIHLDTTVAQELRWGIESDPIIDSEDKLLEVLALILRSERTKQIINTLLAQSLEYGDVEVTIEELDEKDNFDHELG